MIYVDKDCNLVKTTPQAEQARTHAKHLRMAAGLPEVKKLAETTRALLMSLAFAESSIREYSEALDALAPFEEAT